jgi:hypothetical protein
VSKLTQHSNCALFLPNGTLAPSSRHAVDGSPGRVSYGRYAVEDGKVVMYDEDETPVTDRRGNRYELELVEGIEPDQIAARLTKLIRRDQGGDKSGFNRLLTFPKEKIV